MRLILVGPSHIPRIRHALEVVLLPRPTTDIIYLGDGGYPIWNKTVYEKCLNEYRPGDKILLIVADFRFGNGILEETDATLDNNVFIDGHTHVKRELCTPFYDNKMKTHCVRALIAWKKQFGSDLTVFHWTLAMRTVKNRRSKQHIYNSAYRHPVWNINEHFFNLDVTGLSNVQTCPEPELNIFDSLTIDNDLHPSNLGYLYISAVSVTADHESALKIAKTVYMAAMNNFASELIRSKSQTCILCGPSDVLAKLRSSIPLSVQKKLLESGISIHEPGPLPSLDKINDVQKIIYISDLSIPDEKTLTESCHKLLKDFPQSIRSNVSILFWNAIAIQTMQWRARNLRNAPTGSIEKTLAAKTFHCFWPEADYAFDYAKIDRMIEYGAGGAPTLWGIIAVISNACGRNTDKVGASTMNAMYTASEKCNLRIESGPALE